MPRQSHRPPAGMFFTTDPTDFQGWPGSAPAPSVSLIRCLLSFLWPIHQTLEPAVTAETSRATIDSLTPAA